MAVPRGEFPMGRRRVGERIAGRHVDRDHALRGLTGQLQAGRVPDLQAGVGPQRHRHVEGAIRPTPPDAPCRRRVSPSVTPMAVSAWTAVPPVSIRSEASSNDTFGGLPDAS